MLELLFNSAVNILDEDWILWKLLSTLIKLLCFLISCLIIHWRSFAILSFLLILRCSVNHVFSDILTRTIIAKLPIRIKIGPCKYLQLLIWEFADELLVPLQSVLLVSVCRFGPSLSRSFQLLRTGSWLMILWRISVEAKSLSHSNTAFPLLHLLKLMRISVILVSALASLLHNHWSIVIDHNLLTTHHLIIRAMRFWCYLRRSQMLFSERGDIRLRRHLLTNHWIRFPVVAD